MVSIKSFRAKAPVFTSHCLVGSYRKFKVITQIAKINRPRRKISINSPSSQYSRFAIAAYDSIVSFASFRATLTYFTSHCHIVSYRKFKLMPKNSNPSGNINKFERAAFWSIVLVIIRFFHHLLHQPCISNYGRGLINTVIVELNPRSERRKNQIRQCKRIFS